MTSARIVVSTAAILVSLGLSQNCPAETASAPTQNLTGVRMMAPIPDVQATAGHHYGPHVLTESDHEVFTQAFDAAHRFDWERARALAAGGKDKGARDVITWLYLLDETSGAPFDEIDAFQRSHPDWPRRDALLARAEKALPDSVSAQSILTWFGTREPVSGWGQFRLGEALIKTGKRIDGLARIRKGWIENGFPPDQEISILTKYGEHFDSQTQKKRLEQLLRDDDRGGAERQMARVDARSQRIAETRIKLARGLGSPASILSKIPEADRDDPGILFDLARSYRRNGEEERAQTTLLRATYSGEARTYALAFWPERHIDARDALRDGRHKLAYNLVSNSQLTSGTEYSDAEFLAGWIALRFLDNAKLARGHFEKLAAAVATPISKARAYYWIGRASEAEGRERDAADNYMLAANYSTTLYGQLALTRIDDNPILQLRESAPETAGLRATFLADSRVSAMRVIAEMGEDDLLRQFANRMTQDAADSARLRLLADLLVELGNRALAVRAAKQASYMDQYLTEHLYPVTEVPKVPSLSPVPEPALVLAIARQESEFDPQAVSSAGALGIMQLMPGSARAVANAHGLGVRLDDLTRDVNYNMQLGQAHLSDFLSEWGGSFVLAIASYNAGDNNVRKWIAAYGDPRSPNADPIDWIESIPFGETRNYVQRVLENTGVYRNRLAGKNQKLEILADLYRPREASVHVLRVSPSRGSEARSAPTPKAKPGRNADETQDEGIVSAPAPVPKPDETTGKRP